MTAQADMAAEEVAGMRAPSAAAVMRLRTISATRRTITTITANMILADTPFRLFSGY